MVIIKKLIYLLISSLLFLFVACGTTENVSKSKPVNISIETDVDTYKIYTSSVKGITLTPKLEGSTDKDIEYHWSVDSDTEMFDTESGPKKEINNSGESILFVPVAEISYVEPGKFSKAITVTLVVEEKDSNKVVAKTELIIEDYSGTYKVKK